MEDSKALPAHCYGDPADVVERKELRELGCRACKHSVPALNRVYCSHERVVHHNKVPWIGNKCKYFELKG
jgi:hypothetical protein